jgi:hypothetical protein
MTVHDRTRLTGKLLNFFLYVFKELRASLGALRTWYIDWYRAAILLLSFAGAPTIFVTHFHYIYVNYVLGFPLRLSVVFAQIPSLML